MFKKILVCYLSAYVLPVTSENRFFFPAGKNFHCNCLKIFKNPAEMKFAFRIGCNFTSSIC